MDGWVRRIEWFYARCVQEPGGDYGCYPVYSIAGFVLVLIAMVVMIVVARRAYYAWREEARNRAALQARLGVATEEEMEKVKWKGDGLPAADLPYAELVKRIKEEKDRGRRPKDEKNG
jgi:hypothetical protein